MNSKIDRVFELVIGSLTCYVRFRLDNLYILNEAVSNRHNLVCVFVVEEKIEKVAPLRILRLLNSRNSLSQINEVNYYRV